MQQSQAQSEISQVQARPALCRVHIVSLVASSSSTIVRRELLLSAIFGARKDDTGCMDGECVIDVRVPQVGAYQQS